MKQIFILTLISLLVISVATIFYSPLSKQISIHGRYYVKQNLVYYDWVCFKIDFCFVNSTKVLWNITDTWNIYHIVLDQNHTTILQPHKNKQISIYQSSQPESHCIQIIKITENHYGPIASYKDSIFGGLEVIGGVLAKKQKKYDYRFQFMGDSLTTGFGVMSNTNPLCFFKMKYVQNCRESWATHLSKTFNAQYRIQAISGKGVMRNSLAIFGKKMPTSFTRLSDNSEAFSYKFQDNYFPDILFICIGHNDFANLKDPTPQNFVAAYKEMLQMILGQQNLYMKKTTKLVNVCPIQLIPEVCILVQQAVHEYAYGYKDLYYLEIPYGTIGKKDMGCMGHPNVTGHRKMAQALEEGVRKILAL